jgi:large repetitive protein
MSANSCQDFNLFPFPLRHTSTLPIMDIGMKKIFLIVAGLLMAIAIPISVFLVKNQQDIRTKAAPATTLSLTPASLSKSIDDTFTLDATIETGSNQVFVTELHVSYDPTKLEAVSITNGPLFPNIIISGKIDPTGKMSITLGAENQATPVTGTGIAAIVKFKAIGVTTTPTVVQFITADTFAGAKGEGATNVLVGTTPAKITITRTGSQTASAGTTTSTITPTPTTRLTTTLTPTPTPLTTSATSSALIILSPSATISATTTRPLFKGTAPKNATVTLSIYPSSQTVSIKANSSGVWSYTPTSPLVAGPHEVTATAVDPISKDTLTATQSFVIAATTGEGTQDGTPVSGNVSTTLLFLFLGISLLGAGMAIPITKHTH